MHKSWLYTTMAILMMCSVCAFAQEHTVMIRDDGSASDESEGSLMSDSYGRSAGNGQFRGRYGTKLYVENSQKAEGSYHISGVKFPDLKRWLGEGKTIVSAKLELEVCNAVNDKGNPVNVVAYPIIDDWNWQGFSWAFKSYASKFEDWNKAPAPTHFNIKPAPDAAGASKDMFDIAESMGGTKLTAMAHMYGTENTNLKMGDNAEFDITPLVRLWYSGALENNGVALLAPNPGTYVRFFSSNADSYSPTLTVKVSGPGGVPTPPGGGGMGTSKPGGDRGPAIGPPPVIGAPPPPPPPPAPKSAPTIPLL